VTEAAGREAKADAAAPLSASHRLEALAAGAAFALFRALPLGAASALGGFVARTIGPRLGIARRAEKNLRRAFPDWPEARVRAVARQAWDNLGRTAAEYAKLDRIDCYAAGGRVRVSGVEHLDQLRDDGKAGIFFSGHLANWEVMPLAGAQRGLPISLVYRGANNPAVDDMILQARRAITDSNIPKGASGARQLIGIVRSGGHVAILVDQKLNDGIAVPFFGRMAMTAPAIAQLALKFDIPLVPVSCVRRQGARFEVTFHPPLDVPRTGDRAADTLAIMTKVNTMIEGWIRANPGQWLWLHRRWPD
jgi:KDO2-lipid IV(A) lauroyltransferase